MTGTPEKVPLQDVLDEFAMEAEPGRETLERYLSAYPDYAGDLIDLSRELIRQPSSFVGDLTQEEENLIEAAWRKHESTAPRRVPNPLAALTVPQLRSAAVTLGVPRQVLTAFRERLVLSASVPERFLTRFAEAVGQGVEAIRDWLEHGGMPEPERSYKADDKPGEATQVTFEQILADAEVPANRRAELLSDSD